MKDWLSIASLPVISLTLIIITGSYWWLLLILLLAVGTDSLTEEGAG